MESLRGLRARLRGDDLDTLEHLTAEVAEIKHCVLQMNHLLDQLARTVNELNHDVRSGAEDGLPLYLGHAARLRLDADTAIGAAELIERQLALLEDRLAAGSAADRT